MASELQKARHASVQHASRLIRHPDVIGVGIGLRSVGGALTNEPCVKLLVSQKRPLSEIEPWRVLPRWLDTASGRTSTDVEASGEFHAPPAECAVVARDLVAPVPPVTRFRPAPGGVSASHFMFSAGTLGATVTDAVTPGLNYIISCSHVF